MYDRVLVPTDGSDVVEEALDHALDLAARHDAILHAVYVIDQRQFLGAPDDVQSDVRDTLTHEGEVAISTIEERAFEQELEVESELREGIPYKEVLSATDEHDADVIVVASHGKTGRDRLATLGSVTERLVKHADRPVFVVSVEE